MFCPRIAEPLPFWPHWKGPHRTAGPALPRSEGLTEPQGEMGSRTSERWDCGGMGQGHGRSGVDPAGPSQVSLLPLYSVESVQRSPKEGPSSLHPRSPSHPKTSPVIAPRETEAILPVLDAVANTIVSFDVCLSSCSPCPFSISESPPRSLSGSGKLSAMPFHALASSLPGT